MGKDWSPPSLTSCFCACVVHGSYQNGSLFHFCPTLLIKSKNNNKKKPLRVGNKDDLLLLKWYAARIELHLKCACLPLMMCFYSLFAQGMVWFEFIVASASLRNYWYCLTGWEEVSFFFLCPCFFMFPSVRSKRAPCPHLCSYWPEWHQGMTDGDGLRDVSQMPSLFSRCLSLANPCQDGFEILAQSYLENLATSMPG